jgi:hypothetical protein
MSGVNDDFPPLEKIAMACHRQIEEGSCWLRLLRDELPLPKQEVIRSGEQGSDAADGEDQGMKFGASAFASESVLLAGGFGSSDNDLNS